MGASQQKFKVLLVDTYPDKVVDKIAADVIEHIKERSENGQGVRPRGRGYQLYDFPKYSPSYIKSMEFKIGGKNPRSVDLTLSGDMLAAIDVLKKTRSSIEIGFEAGSEENERAEGNQLGSYGGSPKARRARRFLGLTSNELDEILERYDKWKQ